MQEYKFDPSLNILYKEHYNLDYIFNPKSIAIIGASEKENSVGRTLILNLKDSFNGKIFPINPKRNTVFNIKSYKQINDIDDEIDLVIIATPAKTVPDIVKACSEKNVKGVIIISAGFKETGIDGKNLENQIYKNKGNLRIIGPNCLGLINPINKINASFALDMPLKGNIAFISQSGALCTSVLDWSLKEKVGFSAFVSIGSMIDVNFSDLIYYFGNDPNTKSILIYMENISNPKAFLSSCREVALTKPIILIKAGRSKEGSKAATSHTGALTSDNDVFDAALKRVGVLRVDTISELFSLADILAKQSLSNNSNLAIVTNAGGPGVLATDALIISGANLYKLDNNTIEELNKFLPSHWSHSNPVDILGDACDELYFKTIEILSKHEDIGGILTILTPQYMTDPLKVAKKLKAFSKLDKPFFTSFIGGKNIEDAIKVLVEENIVNFSFPEDACKAFAKLCQYSDNLKNLYETPLKEEVLIDKKRKDEVRAIFNNVIKENRYLLDEVESKKILKAYDIPIVDTFLAKTKEEAVEYAKKIQFPVVLKIYSKKITHKKEVGGVKLNLKSPEDVERAYDEIYNSLKKLNMKNEFSGVTIQKMINLEGFELILGSMVDKEFGPTILFGSGGSLVEVYKDKVVALSPLNKNLANNMIKDTKIYNALKKMEINLDNIQNILVKLSELTLDFPIIKELDINPLLATKDKVIALDARCVLYNKNEKITPPSIRAYPSQYIFQDTLKNNEKITLRPIKAQDESLLKKFYQDISETTIKQRYYKTLHYNELIAHERLSRLCFNDYDREIAIVALKKDEIIAVARLSKLLENDASFSLIIKDSYHNLGMGKKLLSKLIEIAKEEKIDNLVSVMFAENVAMLNICKKLNFSFEQQNNIIYVHLKLK
jgi:acetyltransferase